MEKEHVIGPKVDGGELPAELLEGMRSQTPGGKAAEVFAAQVDFDRT